MTTAGYSIIVAFIDANKAIGKDGGKLAVAGVPGELRYFRSMTVGHTVVMGRKTFESIGSKELPGRVNVVISSKNANNEIPETDGQTTVFIIGGQSIYEKYIDKVDVAYITRSFEKICPLSTYDSFFFEDRLLKDFVLASFIDYSSYRREIWTKKTRLQG